MVMTPLLFGLALTAFAAPNSARRVETEAERLHRKGVHCMDVIERSKCAISYFEALLDERTPQRALVTDAILRLLKLYERKDDEQGRREVLRRFWDAGMQRKSGDHVPYTVRFFPPELDVLFTVNIERIRQAQILKVIGSDTAEFVFSCDPERRNNIKQTERWNFARERGARSGKSPSQVIYADMDERREKREQREKQKQARGETSKESPDPQHRVSRPEDKEPIFGSTTCTIAKALGQDNLLGWRRVAGAMSHQDFSRSMGVAQIPELDTLLAAAIKAKTIEVRGDHWVLLGEQFAEQEIHLAKLDHEELLFARKDMVQPVIAARAKRRRRMNRGVHKLVQKVPKDSAVFVVANKSAASGLIFDKMGQGKADFIQALLPKPKGFQLALMVNDLAGVFTRMPTDSAVKGRMLVSLAQRLITGSSEQDPETAEMLGRIDISQTSDRRALLITYLMSTPQLKEMLWK